MSKLLGYDFTIEYKKGKENKVADALSRVFEDPSLPEEATCFMLSFPTPTWLEELKQSYTTDPEAMLLLQRYVLQQGLISKNGRIFIVHSSSFKDKILHYIHSNPQAGHSGYLKTVQRAKADFFWSGMRRDIRKLIRECPICQASKVKNVLFGHHFLLSSLFHLVKNKRSYNNDLPRTAITCNFQTSMENKKKQNKTKQKIPH
jgi:hypothetical protein